MKCEPLTCNAVTLPTGPSVTYLTRPYDPMGNCITCKRFAVLWSLEFLIDPNLEHETIAKIVDDCKELTQYGGD